MVIKTLVVAMMALFFAVSIVPNITQAQSSVSMKEEEDSIRTMWARFEEFYNKNDADGLGLRHLPTLDGDAFPVRAGPCRVRQ